MYGITDVNGTLLVQYEYDVWGKVKDITGNQTLGQLNPMRYRGYYYDEETGLYYLQSRYYDASVRRFINADKFSMIGVSDTIMSYNLYSYCENEPVYNLDDSGTATLNATKYKIIQSEIYVNNKRKKQNTFLFTTTLSVLFHSYDISYSLTPEKYVSIDLGAKNMSIIVVGSKLDSLAKEMVNIVKKKSSYGLKGRTKKGVYAQLVINYVSYCFDKVDRILLIGGTLSTIKGYRSDSNLYELAGFIDVAYDLITFVRDIPKNTEKILKILNSLSPYFNEQY